MCGEAGHSISIKETPAKIRESELRFEQLCKEGKVAKIRESELRFEQLCKEGKVFALSLEFEQKVIKISDFMEF